MTRELARVNHGDDKTLMDFRQAIGERLVLEQSSPRARFNVRLVGMQEGGSVIVSAPRGSRQGNVRPGSRFTLRLIAGNWICAFETRLLCVVNEPYAQWHLEYPQHLDVQRLRQRTRVPVALQVAIEPMQTQAGAERVAALCTDIHQSGACVESDQPLGEVGQSVYLSARVNVGQGDYQILTPAVIRNRVQREASPYAVYAHGVEFNDLDEDTRLILTGFVYQQFLVETGYLAPESQ